MKKTMSLKQLAANQRNALKSTGPKTVNGKAVSKMNALKHGILSTQVLVRGQHGRENAREFTALHRRFTEELRPMGPLEEMLVDQIVTAHWRLRRALTAEAGEIAKSVGNHEWGREHERHPVLQWLVWRAHGDPIPSMHGSAEGNATLRIWLDDLRQSVEREGELTEAAVQKLVQNFGGEPNVLTRNLETLRLRLQENPNHLDADALRARNKAEALRHLSQELGMAQWRESECEQRVKEQTAAKQAAATLPSAGVLDKILRYETKLERQMFRTMNQLERLQRMRQGETVPAPLTMDVAGKEAE